MKEKTEIIPDEENTATTPQEKVIPIKFNKEVRNLSLDEASVLSQKGLKFDAIEAQWERFKALACAENSSTADFLTALENRRTEKRIEELTEECGGNSEMAKKIVLLEGITPHTLKGEKDLLEFFPDKTTDDLPQEVLDRANQNNTNVLDEYLRYSAKKAMEEAREKAQREINRKSSVGSQKNCGIYHTPESEEFIRGLWNK